MSKGEKLNNELKEEAVTLLNEIFSFIPSLYILLS
ncbi:MAG: hypothetical protein ACI8PB_005032 [Desulforhopalus sp.]|jgi:hypothetical protein